MAEKKAKIKNEKQEKLSEQLSQSGVSERVEKLVKEKRQSRNILLKTIESKTKVLNYWRGKYLAALNEVRQARDNLSKLIEENEPTSQEKVNAHQQISNNQTDKTVVSPNQPEQQPTSKLVDCIHCKVQKQSTEMHYYPASMTYRCDNCRKILEDQLLASQREEQKEKEVVKPPLFRK